MDLSGWQNLTEIYDWKSVMHYEWWYFLESGDATMTVKGIK